MELKEAIEILNQCTNDWNELCHCVFKDADEKDYKCVGCREKALEVVLNHITKQEKMIQKIHENFCKFDWKNSNGEEVHNQLKELYESIFKNQESE